jgi:hypothetical protein
MRHPDLSSRSDLVERVASALMQASVYDRAGELFERVQMPQRALEAYKQGKAFAKAVDLARGAFPDEVAYMLLCYPHLSDTSCFEQVVRLEDQWGDHLVRLKQMDQAIPHFIEAGRTEKAIEAAISARQWTKAAQVAARPRKMREARLRSCRLWTCKMKAQHNHTTRCLPITTLPCETFAMLKSKHNGAKSLGLAQHTVLCQVLPTCTRPQSSHRNVRDGWTMGQSPQTQLSLHAKGSSCRHLCCQGMIHDILTSVGCHVRDLSV